MVKVFACLFLSDETTNSFLWLFEHFKKATPGGSPKMIITDQDSTMTKASVQAFPILQMALFLNNKVLFA